MINDLTPHMGLPLPHPTNALEDDVFRLRDALSDIDAKIATIDAILASDDIDLDVLQEVVNAIKSNQTLISTITGNISAVSGRVTVLEGLLPTEETHVLTEGQTVIDLTVLTSTIGARVFVEGVRLKASAWTPHPTIPTRLTLNTTYPAGHEVTVERQQGGV